MNIWVNGCFDILHTGHIDLLRYAKNYSDSTDPNNIPNNRLFLGLDGDERVKILKGKGRPINDVGTRMVIMISLKMVDNVFIFNTDDELREIIKSLKIDYIVVGDQYKNKEVIGGENAKLGVVFYPVDQRSSTNIIENIRKEAQLEILKAVNDIIKTKS